MDKWTWNVSAASFSLVALRSLIFVVYFIIIIIIINNNNNNNNNNSNFPHTHFYNDSLCYRKKTIKMDKSVKIYQYITVNTKNMTN